MFNFRRLLTTITLSVALALCVNAKTDLVEVVKINSHIKLDIKYATTDNFTHKVVYPSARCYLRKEAAEKIDAVQKELERQGLGLKIFDGYRPASVQKIFWDIFPDERYVSNPANKSRYNQHCRGVAVDLTLVDLKTGNELDMPSDFDDLSPKAHRNYDAMKSQAAKKNCKLLEDIMVKYGFKPINSEWWHFNLVGWEKYKILDISFDELEKKTT